MDGRRPEWTSSVNGHLADACGVDQMLEVLRSREDIAAAQQKLQDQLDSLRSESVRAYVGYRGGRYEGSVRWFPELNLWHVTQVVRDGRQYWNGFGTTRPKEGSSLSITCEINSPVRGIDRRIGGAFTRDDDGKFWLVHRGKIGGGRPGIGKSSFAEAYRGEWITVVDGDRSTDVVPISSLESDRLVVRVNAFVREVARIKREAVTSSPLVDDGLFAGFTEEFSGPRAKYSGSSVEASCDHGQIVNALAAEAESRGMTPHSDVYRDLYTRGSQRKAVVLFEVKTGNDRTSLYCGVGQVLLHAAALGTDVVKVLVLPQAPRDNRLAEALQALGIRIVTFDLDGPQVRFAGLGDIWR